MSVETDAALATEFRIDPATRPGHVHLTVANLDNELAFYQKVIGLQVHWREGSLKNPQGHSCVAILPCRAESPKATFTKLS